MAVYEVYGEGDTSQRRIEVEVYGRYVNNGVSIVVGSEGENLVTELAFHGIPELGINQVATMKWYAEQDGIKVGAAQLLTRETGSGKWVASIQNGMTQYNHADAYIQVDAEGKVWRSYAFKILFAILPKADANAPSPDAALIDQMLAEFELVLKTSKEYRDEVIQAAEGIAQEVTAQSIDEKVHEALVLLAQIAGNTMRGFWLERDGLGRVKIIWVNPEDEEDRTEILLATESTAQMVAAELEGINESLRKMAEEEMRQEV